MVFCRNRGFTYVLIRDKLRNRYNIDLTPTVIQKYVVNYEEDKEIEKEEKEEEVVQEIPDRNTENWKKIQAMYAELTRLRAKVTEYEKEKAELKHKEEIKQAVQTALQEQSTSKKGFWDFLNK